MIVDSLLLVIVDILVDSDSKNLYLVKVVGLVFSSVTSLLLMTVDCPVDSDSR